MALCENIWAGVRPRVCRVCCVCVYSRVHLSGPEECTHSWIHLAFFTFWRELSLSVPWGSEFWWELSLSVPKKSPKEKVNEE